VEKHPSNYHGCRYPKEELLRRKMQKVSTAKKPNGEAFYSRCSSSKPSPAKHSKEMVMYLI
jgi:hypothetical protein